MTRIWPWQTFLRIWVSDVTCIWLRQTGLEMWSSDMTHIWSRQTFWGKWLSSVTRIWTRQTFGGICESDLTRTIWTWIGMAEFLLHDTLIGIWKIWHDYEMAELTLYMTNFFWNLIDLTWRRRWLIFAMPDNLKGIWKICHDTRVAYFFLYMAHFLILIDLTRLRVCWICAIHDNLFRIW